jgi:hypothetical protein
LRSGCAGEAKRDRGEGAAHGNGETGRIHQAVQGRRWSGKGIIPSACRRCEVLYVGFRLLQPEIPAPSPARDRHEFIRRHAVRSRRRQPRGDCH